MEATQTTNIEKVEVVNGAVDVYEQQTTFVDAVQVSTNYFLRTIHSGDDYSEEESVVQDVCKTLFV